jgi:hypothetical protein
MKIQGIRDFLNITLENINKSNIEKNIFDIGVKKMYENPFTEILSYLISKNNGYQNRNIFLNVFLDEIIPNDNKAKKSLIKNINVKTQIVTANGNIMDMILYNDEYIITFENKIGHKPINPFDDYEKEIEKQFPNNKKYFILFSLNECEEIINWENKLIGDIFKNIQDKIGKSHTKWDFFVSDFLKHYIKENLVMNNNNFVFCTKNFSNLYNVKVLYDNFIKELKKKIKNEVEISNIVTETWGDDAFVIRIRPLEKTKSDVVFMLLLNNRYSISIYYDDKYYKKTDLLKKKIGKKYYQWYEGNWNCFRLEKDLIYDDIDEALKETYLQLKKMKEIY